MDNESEENKKKLDQLSFNWNTMTLDECIQHLEKKHMFSSTGESFCVNKLIAAYKMLKNE